ncbi:MAG: hypothetical protein LBL95_04055, partial [Deltaproteobacteria bacterium]|nr:hypothetical protein [Deltaproteobacteria bacterium]
LALLFEFLPSEESGRTKLYQKIHIESLAFNQRLLLAKVDVLRAKWASHSRRRDYFVRYMKY